MNRLRIQDEVGKLEYCTQMVELNRSFTREKINSLFNTRIKYKFDCFNTLFIQFFMIPRIQKKKQKPQVPTFSKKKTSSSKKNFEQDLFLFTSEEAFPSFSLVFHFSLSFLLMGFQFFFLWFFSFFFHRFITTLLSFVIFPTLLPP